MTTRNQAQPAVVDWLEGSETLQRVGASVRQPVAALLEGKRFRDVLSGAWLGHPTHPALVLVPVGMWSGALVADLSGDARTAQRLTAVGLAGAVPATAAGMSDWLDTAGAEQRVGVVHMGVNVVATALVGAGWVARRAGWARSGGMLGAAGLLFAGVGGWLGGHLAYAFGVGVDTNAFDGGPAEWTDLAVDPPAEGAAPIRSGEADGISLAIVQPDGRDAPAVLANRCSHRGGPLSDGEIDGSCIRCPWHGSEFDVATGAVVRGPATVAQPAYEVRRSVDGWQVRRDEPRALRVNSVRAGS